GGVFARLAAHAGVDGLPPVTLLALLKHPLLRLGASEGTHVRAIAALERAILRGSRPRRGSDGLNNALAAFRDELQKFRRKERSELHPTDPRTALSDADLEAAGNLVIELIAALAPIECLREGPHAFAELAERHYRAVEQLSDGGTGVALAFAGTDGAALASVLEEIAASPSAESLRVALSDYPETFEAAIGSHKVPVPPRIGAQVSVLGVLESRLTSFDRVILGGLNEGSWPPEVKGDALLNRPMRPHLRPHFPERRLSPSTHDFPHALPGACEIVLSRATKAEGAPTVASRFLQRLTAVAGPRWRSVGDRGERYLHWARTLDRPASPARIKKPAPRPPREARPLMLSVTD